MSHFSYQVFLLVRFRFNFVSIFFLLASVSFSFMEGRATLGLDSRWVQPCFSWPLQLYCVTCHDEHTLAESEMERAIKRVKNSKLLGIWDDIESFMVTANADS